MKRVSSTNQTKYGKGKLQFKWSSSHLATAGVNNTIFITDKHADLVDSFVQSSLVTFDWSFDSLYLAILSENTLSLWSTDSLKQSLTLDTGLKQCSSLSWSLDSQSIAIGTQKGNLLIYHLSSSKKIPIIGKHQKSIVSISWNFENEIACISDDRSVHLINPVFSF